MALRWNKKKSFDVTKVKIYENIRFQCINTEFYVVVSSYKQIILSLFPVENNFIFGRTGKYLRNKMVKTRAIQNMDYFLLGNFISSISVYCMAQKPNCIRRGFWKFWLEMCYIKVRVVLTSLLNNSSVLKVTVILSYLM